MNDMRQTRVGNYAIKKAAGFRCEVCGRTDQLLAVDVPSEDRSACLCEECIPDKRTHRPRAGQWDEAARLREQLAKRPA